MRHITTTTARTLAEGFVRTELPQTVGRPLTTREYEYVDEIADSIRTKAKDEGWDDEALTTTQAAYLADAWAVAALEVDGGVKAEAAL